MKHSVVNHSKMFGSVTSLLELNSALWDSIVPMKNTVTAFKATTDAILKAGRVQAQTSSGITIDKKNLRMTIIEKMLTVTGGLQAFAVINDNMELYENVHVGEGKLKQLSAMNFISKVQFIIGIANEHLAELADYNVPEATVTSVANDAEAYIEIMPKSRDTISKVKHATAQMDDLVRKGMAQLAMIKNFMKTFKNGHADFYAVVMSASKIVEYGVRHNKFSGKVEKNGVAVPGATLKVVEENKETVAAWDGEFEMEGIHTGKFTLIVSDGVTEKTIHNLTMRRGTDLNMIINMAA